MTLTTLDPHDDGVARSVSALDDAIDQQNGLDRLVRVLMGCELRRLDGGKRGMEARQGPTSWIEIGPYGSWTGQFNNQLAVKSGRGSGAACVALLRAFRPDECPTQAKALEALTTLLQLGVSVTEFQTKTAIKIVACHYPAPPDFRVPTPGELAAAFNRGETREAIAAIMAAATAVYTYTDARGGFYFYNVRREDPAAGTKTFIKAACVVNGGLEAESSVRKLNLTKDLPLYGIVDLVQRPDAPVIVVEGEKTCHAARIRFPGHVCVTWSGGAHRVAQTDWTPLVTRSVVVFPDNDPDGYRAANDVLTALAQATRRCVRPQQASARLMRVIADVPQHMLPPSHDLGDPDPPGLEGWAEDCLARAEAPDADVAEVNRRFVFVEEPESGEAYVLLRNPEPIGRHGLPPIYCRLNVTAFQSHFLNNRVMVPGPRGMVERTLAEKWLGDPHRATVTRVVCDPSPEGPRDPGVFNLWRGFRTTPGESGDAALWPTISRLLDAMTRDEPVVRRYVEGWCAHLFQRPERLPLVSIVIRSTQQGVGKSSFAQLLALMVGRHAHIITNPQADLLGTFNAGLEHKVLIDIEELNGREARAAADHLKNLITSPRLQINQKNEAVRTIDNYARVIITSNDEIVAPSGIDARRFLYLTMDARFKTRPGWQNDLIAFNNATINDDNPDHPELRAFRRYLMDLDISGWAPHNLPDTDDRRSHIEAEIEHDITMSWWVACLENGVVCGVPWPKQVIFLALEVDYNRFCDTQHRHPLGRNRFRSNLRTWIFGRDRRGWPSDRERIVVSKVEMSPVIRAQASAMRDMASAEAGFKLPSRERCAEAFYEATGYRVELAPAPIDLATPPPALPADGGNPSPADRGDPTDGLEFAPF